MENCLGIDYKLDTSENFSEYLKFIEVGFMYRNFGNTVSPVVALFKNADGTYTYTMYTALRSSTTTFTLGEEFTEVRPDGVKVRSIITLEGNKLIQVQVEQNGRTSTHIREFTPDTLTVTSTADGWDGKSVRVYKRIMGKISEGLLRKSKFEVRI